MIRTLYYSALGNVRLRRMARAIRSHLLRGEFPRRCWSFLPDLSLWAEQINSPTTEQFTGIHCKIAQIRRLGTVKVVGGLTTGGGDDLFYMNWPDSLHALSSLMDELADGQFLLLYVPHYFWARVLDERYQWLPTWNELFDLFDGDRQWTVFQYSPSFDAAGRYFFIAQKRSCNKRLPPESLLTRQTFRVFFRPCGADLTQGHSSFALSAHLCCALSRIGAVVHSYSFMDADAVFEAEPHDILIGHVGLWVRAAYGHGMRRIILYNPANRWYATRNLPEHEANATIAEQVEMSQMVIAQSGAIWRLTQDYPRPKKWRWIDLGIDPLLFPRVKQKFNPVGQRQFCFVHLYDATQKGSDIAQAIIRARPGYHFSWIGGQVVGASNVRYYAPRPNTGMAFRRIVSDCDFILVPSREDAQPGTLIEATALGLLPVATYASGYSLSYPRLVEPDRLEEWLKVVDYLQRVPEDDLMRARSGFDSYLRAIHSWPVVENQIVFYLREFLQRELAGED